MNSNKFGWDLPPGVTNSDIDRNAGAILSCDRCGHDFACNDAPYIDPETDDEVLCPRCQHAED